MCWDSSPTYKFRVFALTAASLAWTYVRLVCFAGDDNTNSQPSPQNAPAATTPVDPERNQNFARDGSINAIDAIGHHNVGCAARDSNSNILTLPSCGYG